MIESIGKTIEDLSFVIFFSTPILATICAVIFTLLKKKCRKTICFLWWLGFPLLFPHFAKRYGGVNKSWKRWILVFFSPAWLVVLLVLLLVFLSFAVVGGPEIHTQEPDSVEFHNAEDITKIIGVDVPDVEPVDSLMTFGRDFHDVTVTFVTKQKPKRKFFRQLDKWCEQDKLHWRKDDKEYFFFKNRRDYAPSSGGEYLNVTISIKGDTIWVSKGDSE